ncbi:MAG: hypothetical protein ABSF69_28815 [Polyangiaceae bacterium]|jgi:hypothetical protein
MRLTFRQLAVFASLVCFLLALTWLFAPRLLLRMWGIDYSYPVGLVGRRGAALFLGMGVMFIAARDAPPSPSRAAMAQGFSVALLSLATLGVVELSTRHAGPGILSAVVVEVALAWMIIAVTRRDSVREVQTYGGSSSES